MPIQKFNHKEPRLYDIPFVGQVFCRLQQDGREEWGVIDGVRPVYAERLNAETQKKEWALSDWTASLTTGFTDFRGLLRHNAAYHTETDWHPAPAEYQMSPAVRGLFADLHALNVSMNETLVLLNERITALEGASAPAPTTQPLASTPVTGERPRRGATA